MPHIVAQEVEAKLPHGAVHNVGAVGAAPLVVVHVLEHCPDGKAQRLVDRREVLGVPKGEVVVRRDHVDAPALHGVTDGREDGSDGLALSRTHLDDVSAPHVQPGEDLLVRGRKQAAAYRFGDNAERRHRRIVPLASTGLGEGACQLTVG